MILNLTLTIRCKLCGNIKDSNYYTMPVEKKVKDGSYFSFTEYKVVCKICGQSHILKTTLE